MDFEQYRYTPQTPLASYPTSADGDIKRAALGDFRKTQWAQLAEYQERLYAESGQSLLVVVQAMDAAGKDSTIGKLTHQLYAHGCHVHAFKKPSKLELAHDFLWRVHQKVPAQGEITFFNRSHYEDVLIVKVHGWASQAKLDARYQQINSFEALLADRGTRVVKFMLNISPEYQLGRFQSRLKNKAKNWKFNPGDLDERAKWTEYMSAFEIAMSKCTTEQAPWYIVPAENRRYRDAMIASVILQTLKDMDPQYPEPDFDADKFTADSIS